MTFRWLRDRLLPSTSAKKPGRIFLIGHNKCGTRSFVRLLRSNGYKSIHFGNGRAARQIQANFTFSRPLLEGLDRFTGYADRYLHMMRAAFNNPSLDIDDLRRHWKQAWKRHETDLERNFTGRNNYFAFDIGVPEDQAKLCCFLRSRGYSIEGDALPHVGATRASEA